MGAARSPRDAGDDVVAVLVVEAGEPRRARRSGVGVWRKRDQERCDRDEEPRTPHHLHRYYAPPPLSTATRSRLAKPTVGKGPGRGLGGSPRSIPAPRAGGSTRRPGTPPPPTRRGS